MKRWSPFFVVLALFLCLSSCAPAEPQEENRAEWVEYDRALLLESVSLDTYTGLDISVESGALTKSEAVFDAIVARAEILDYPREQLDYYAEQERAKYRYLEEEVSEETILETAKRLVKEDMVYRYIVMDMGMELTETEKETHFDRYVEKYVADYGYTEEYVKENMSELVYESMLYDKTMEYLILHNTVTLPEELG